MANMDATESGSVPPQERMDANVSRISARLGQRVVRGPGWTLDDQDGGDGHVGTVIVVEHHPGDGDESSKCVWVVWDVGYVGHYRASRNGACDLRLYDSGPVGIAFPKVICGGCREIGIIGTQWKCSVCDDYNLCHPCYMAGEHRLDHPFLRIDVPGADGVKVPPRQGSKEVPVHGIFARAEVVRGIHWAFKNQDGGDGNVGTVVSIGQWKKSTVRNEACVRWPDGFSENYRLGFRGYVDLMCTKAVFGGTFYKDHMPLIAPVDVSQSEVGKSGFRTGEQVSVTVDADRLKRLQEGHGSWTSSMVKIINKLGTVQDDTLNGDVRVSFGSHQNWVLNPAALTKGVHTGAPEVEGKSLHCACYSGDEDTVRRLASPEANLEEEAEDGDRPIHCAAKGNKPGILCFLINRGADINARNKRNQSALHITVNKGFADCVRVLTESASRLDVNIQDEDGNTPIHDAVGSNSQQVIEMLVNCPGADFTIKNKDGFNVLHKAALKGNNFAVKQILSKNPVLVNVTKKDGYGALHIAAINGYFDVVATLLNEPKCTVDLENTEHRTPLQLAVDHGYCGVVELLVQANADINKPDGRGDTSMHLSLKRRSEVQSHLLRPSNSPAVREIWQSLLESGQHGPVSSLALACFLASRGGDVHQRNIKGKSSLDIAKTGAEVELLLDWSRKKCGVTSRYATPSADERPVIKAMVCILCKECPANVRFHPCGHNLFCEECCKRMKDCLKCNVKIEERELTNGKAESGEEKGLDSKRRSMEDSPKCGICADREANVVFRCGHRACHDCVQNLRNCHVCHQPITNYINL